MALCLALALAAVVGGDRAGLFGRARTPDRQKYHDQTFRVVHVVDGDTIDVDVPDGPHRRTRIRLWGVDTPETKKPDTTTQHYGPEAAEFAASLTMPAGQPATVRLELESGRDSRDKYRRLLAFVYLPDGRLLNRVLVEEGYAYADPRYEHHLKSEFQRLQTAARKAGLGLWGRARNEDLPYYYRDRLKLSEK